MLRIRLSRTGKKNYATFRIVVTPLREKQESRVVEILGHYDPHLTERKYKIDTERAKYWVGVGAQPSETVARFLVAEGVIPAPKFKRKFNKKPGKKAAARASEKKA